MLRWPMYSIRKYKKFKKVLSEILEIVDLDVYKSELVREIIQVKGEVQQR